MISGVPKVKLSNGTEIPQLGFGVFQIKGDELTEKCVLEALKIGYRHIDTAHIYENERGVGSAIKKSSVPREDIWITSKVWINEYGSGKTLTAVEKMLKRLDVEYIDLVLLHFPQKDYIGAYKELEIMCEKGKIRNIGLSNFEDSKFDEICKAAKIKPAVNQIELHPYFQQKGIRKKMEAENCQVGGWSPLCRGSDNLFKEEIIKKLSLKYNKTAAQIILRWHIQSGFITIPKSIKAERMRENYNIFDFSLDEGDMAEINKLDGKKGRLQYGPFLLRVGLWLMPSPKD